MTIKEMQDNVVGKYGLEAKETITFFKLCDKLKEDNMVNNAILKLKIKLRKTHKLHLQKLLLIQLQNVAK